MLIMKPYFICWLFLMIFAHHAIGQDPHMTLYAPQPNDVIRNAGYAGCLKNDVDYFTVAGKVNINGLNPDAYKATNLYLQAKPNSSTNGWASQCRPDLTVCDENLKTDCHCENKTSNGDYYIVMTIMAKAIYSGGKLMLSWNDARSPFNPPMLSSQVDYYNQTISYPVGVTKEINETNATFCVHNLEPSSLIQIKKETIILIQTSTDSCVSVSINQTECQKFTLEYTESGGCERKDTIVYDLGPCAECVPGLECYEIALIVIFAVMLPFCLIILLIILCCCCTKESEDDSPPNSKCDNARYTKPQNVKTALYLIVIIIVLLLVSLIGAILVLVLIFSVGPSTCGTGLQPCEIALIVVFVGLIPLILIIVLIVLICCCPKAWDACKRRVCHQDDEKYPEQSKQDGSNSKPSTVTIKL